MENFEYSIQLNNQDWADFYLASEECSLMQPALASAEEQLPSDLEEGGEEESRVIRARAGPNPASSTASCPLHGAPRGRLLAEAVLPGSEDEPDLGSVSRFLCDNCECGAAFPQPSAIQGSQLSPVTSEPSGGLPERPELARECEALFAAEGGESETGDRLADSDHVLPGVDIAAPKAEFQGQISGREAMEEPVCSVPMSTGASKGRENQTGEHGNRPPGLALQQPTADISQAALDDVPLSLSVKSYSVCGNPELDSRDLDGHASSSSFPSAESEDGKHLQVKRKAERPLLQEKPSLFQGLSVPLVETLAHSDPLSESQEERVLERRSNQEENATDLKDEGQANQREDLTQCILKEEGQTDQEVRVNLQKLPEEHNCPPLRIVTVTRCSGSLDQHGETAGLKAKTQKDGMEGSCHSLGTAVPFEGGLGSTAQGSQRSNFLEDNIPYCLALEDSLEGNLTTVTRPQEYDCFPCGNTQQHTENIQDKASEDNLVPDVSQDLPKMYGPEMYEYFFTDVEGAWVGNRGREKEMGQEMLRSSDQPLAPSISSQYSDSIAADDTTHISVPEVYEHFFNNRAQDRKSWKHLFLSMPASEARKAVRALKTLLSKPAHFLRGHPPSPGTLLRRGSHGKLVVFSPRLQEESHSRPADLKMAVMSPVLLANFGTLSAIRYFRRQIAAEGEPGT